MEFCGGWALIFIKFFRGRPIFFSWVNPYFMEVFRGESNFIQSSAVKRKVRSSTGRLQILIAIALSVLQAVTVLVAMVSRKNFGDKIAVKVTNLTTCVQRLRAKLFSRSSRDFARCIFLVPVVSVYDLFKFI